MGRLRTFFEQHTRPTPMTSRAGHKMVELSHTRLMVVQLAFGLIFSLIAFRLVGLVWFEENKPASASPLSTAEHKVNRQDIIDRNGEIIATNLSTASVYANPQDVIDKTEAVEQLSQILPELDKVQLAKEFSSNKRFFWIKRNLTPKQQNAVHTLGLPGVYFEKEERRVYPQGGLLAHVLGYVSIDGHGIAGAEKHFDQQLMQHNNGPLQLSIDVRVQSILHRELVDAVTKFKAKGASGVVMDAKTGEMLAMVSLPDFDPHMPGNADNDAKFNRVTLGVYEMGSTFKTFTMAMALDAKTIGLGSVYDVSEPIQIARFRIRDSHPKAPWLTVPEIYMYSSNIGTAKIGRELGATRQQEYLKRFGLLSPLKLEIAEKSPPLVPNAWKEIQTMTISFGHGLAVTPVHVVQATAAVVNGGIFHYATLLKKDTASSADDAPLVISAATSESMRKLMRLVVEHGTGSRSNVAGYLVGGKTGTAEKARKGGYNRRAMLSSFVGVFPMNDPRYVVLAMVDEPQGMFVTGGFTAAPVVGSVISRIAPLLGMQPIDEQDETIKKQLYVDYEKRGRDLAAF